MSYMNETTGLRAQVWWVRLDFEDFRTIDASPRVRQAFDAGFVLLHELLHALGHRDSPEALGECERILNDARQELGLPQRLDYAATWVSDGRLRPRQARLRFHEGTPTAARQVSSLFFQAPTARMFKPGGPAGVVVRARPASEAPQPRARS